MKILFLLFYYQRTTIVLMKKERSKILFTFFYFFSSVIIVALGVFIFSPEKALIKNLDTAPKRATEKTFNFIIGGDVMLGRAVAWHFDNDVTKAFENLPAEIFADKDLAMVNLEGPISSENIKPDPTANNFTFNFPVNSINTLNYLNLNAVSLGNNHSENQGSAGLNTTRDLLAKNDIVAIGSEKNFDDNSVSEFKGSGINLSVITINTLASKDDLTASIEKEKARGNLVMVFPHWGNEYQSTHSSSQQQLARSWIDAGADIIIGSHPHVLQDAEIYNNKLIFYSLGNLIFDQNFSEETQRGMILAGKFVNEEVEITFLPTKIAKYQVSLLQEKEKELSIAIYRRYLGEKYFINKDTITINQ
ncbi:TPA: hypothetical protein DD449_01065 [Candidatus Berkelbacteria bacterium]|uniref:Capsule synthesis protein CapA domain-containing protein n=1 Tax=Berkelbacteria bacterium GW2011_GWE1_39_12 TaxID=1618337 RepID=A0A0G4B3V9_9BACT|nr:MAG: hypothetical protein UT28_C0001G0874 [Berkelbacteria bacterium GW2011_GWE1_39_12]HBO60262.1 hypothetical protein [Candidatus Berkelbacteria bacterium]